MHAGLLIVIVPVAILVVALAAAVRWARRAMAGGHRLPAALGFAAAAGSAGAAVIALSPLWSDLQYGIVILPIAALVVAACWNALLLIPAALVMRMRQRADMTTIR